MGDPIICAGYDLQEGLRHKNTARMAREDGPAPPDNDDDVEVEAATSQPLQTATQQPETPPDATNLTRAQKRKNIKKVRDRAKRKVTTIENLNGMTAPVPTLRVLKKAAQVAPINVSFTAQDFRATHRQWTGLNKLLDHPLLTHANEPEILKSHMQYVDWQGE
jgi:hypothetical protein